MNVHSDISIDFSPQITLIEGANETGKSTLIEALHRTLFLKATATRSPKIKTDPKTRKYLFFSALATICDQMPMRMDNKIIVHNGLKKIRSILVAAPIAIFPSWLKLRVKIFPAQETEVPVFRVVH